jgi:membrane associated rhomboid family serine protease
MLQDISSALGQIIAVMQLNSVTTLKIIGTLWLIQFANAGVGYRFNLLGIHPRELFGLVGIPLSPFLHGNFNHLFFNTIPLFLLLNLMLAYGWHPFVVYTVNIGLFGGLLTWLLGRNAIHVGASGVIMGYMGFLLMQAIHHQTTYTLILGILALYYCGSILLSLLPSDAQTSWEGHVFGFAAGLCVGYGWFIHF